VVGDPSGPGAEKGDDLERPSLISSLVRGVANGLLFQSASGGKGAFGGEEVV